ncbi:HAD-IC family P-type ATPase, partial [Bacteroides thetaiotaomicron]
TDPEQGLTAGQAAERAAAGYANLPVEAPTKTELQIVRDNVFTFFNLIFVVLAVCLLFVGDFRDMLFLVIAVANTLIGIVQEIRSKRTIDKLTLLSAPRATVVRDGQVGTLPTDKLVRDDVVLFAAGNQIPADAVVLTGEIQVNESLLTGEPDAIVKRPGDTLLSGSFVVAGSGRAQLTKVGAESYASRLTMEAKKDAGPGQSEMMNSLDKLIRVIGIALVPMGIALFVKQYFFLESTLSHAITSTVAALIGMIPEGLYLLTSVALAVSVIRLARKKTLVHDMSSIETLARVDVLCVDKTGTITEPVSAAADADNDTARAMAARFREKSVWKADKVVPFTSATKWSAVSFVGHGSYVVGAPEFVMGQRYADLKDIAEEYSAQGE